MSRIAFRLSARSGTARVFRDVLLVAAQRSAAVFPSLPSTVDEHAVLILNGLRRSGPLGSYQQGAWKTRGRRLDVLTIAPNHPTHVHPDPHVWSERVFVTMLHELAHAATHLPDQPRPAWPSVTSHSASFASAASRLGLEVSWSPANRVGAVTPSLSAYARARHTDLILSLAAVLPRLDEGAVWVAAPVWAQDHEEQLLESFLSDPNH